MKNAFILVTTCLVIYLALATFEYFYLGVSSLKECAIIVVIYLIFTSIFFKNGNTKQR